MMGDPSEAGRNRAASLSRRRLRHAMSLLDSISRRRADLFEGPPQARAAAIDRARREVAQIAEILEMAEFVATGRPGIDVSPAGSSTKKDPFDGSS